MSPIIPNGKATHPESLDGPLDCQDVSRYPAIDPSYWGEKAPPIRWRWFVPIAALAVVIALVIVAPFAMDWPSAAKLAVAVPVFVLGVVALRWIR